MSRKALISAYTPSNTDPALLERIFVQREQLLKQIVVRLKTSMSSKDKHHILLVGPRGSGKTHMVTLALWQLRHLPELQDSMRIAWLGEDDIFSGLIHLAFAIAKSLSLEYPGEFPEDFRTNVRGLAPDDAALSVLGTVVERLQHRHLLLVTENLDQTFSALGDLGQKKLRAFLQETRRIASLATSQQLFDGVSKRDESFFGFFDTYHLEPLTVDHARQLIRNIAEETQNKALLEFLGTSNARYRIRALHHLAGGNHRMYVLLSEFLTRESLDDLIVAFELLAEEMTPYFQERMRALPDQQRQLVQSLCDASGALTVKELSEQTFIAEGNCSKQLSHLKAKGYVRSEKRGKESYYDMAEPLMRLCLEIKNQRGKPLKLVARFLKAWFPESKLRAAMMLSEERTSDYCKLALSVDFTHESSLASQLDQEFKREFACGNYSNARHLANEMREVNQATGSIAIAQLNLAIKDWPAAIEALNETIDFPNVRPSLKAAALFSLGWIYRQMGDIHSALTNYTAAIEVSGAPTQLRSTAFFSRAILYQMKKDTQGALADYTAVIEMPEETSERRVKALINRGGIHHQEGNSPSALADYTVVAELSDASSAHKATARFNRGVIYSEIGDLDSAQADFTAIIEMQDAPTVMRAEALINRGVQHGQRGHSTAELSDYTAIAEMPENLSEQKAIALTYRGMTHHKLGDTRSALADYVAVIQMPNAPPLQKATAYGNRAVINWQIQSWEASVNDFNAALQSPIADPELRTRSLFSLPEPMVPIRSRREVVQALDHAFYDGDRSTQEYGGAPGDLLATILKHGPSDWASYVEAIAPMYIANGVVDKLGHAVTQSIQVLDERQFSSAQLDQWLSAWQNVAQGCEGLEIPLACLAAATEVLKSNPASDRALFQLPLEIRQLVRPLLRNTLSLHRD